jgi:DNA-binding transcriptional ArsR family regulator
MSEFLRDPISQSQFELPKTNQLESTATSLDYLSIKKVALIFRALNHKLRQDMIRMIDKKGMVSVTEIFVDLRLEQSVASQHLAILRRAGILETQREGKFMYYKLNSDRLHLINQMVVDLLK